MQVALHQGHHALVSQATHRGLQGSHERQLVLGIDDACEPSHGIAHFTTAVVAAVGRELVGDASIAQRFEQHGDPACVGGQDADGGTLDACIELGLEFTSELLCLEPAPCLRAGVVLLPELVLFAGVGVRLRRYFPNSHGDRNFAYFAAVWLQCAEAGLHPSFGFHHWFYDRIHCVEDVVRAAEVAHQVVYLRLVVALQLVLEGLQGAQVCIAPAVDRLLGVTDNEEPGACMG